jgi:glucoamylase
MAKLLLYFSILLTTAIFVSLTVFAEPNSKNQVQIEMAVSRILQNFDHPGVTSGAIIASPSRSEPDYFYHWTRDAGLTALSLIPYANRYPQLKTSIQNWARFERFAQSQSFNSEGGLGEPKFSVDGQPYKGPWGRPQNDGPAIRSLAYLRAFHKIDRFVEADISYLLKNWQNPNFDLWEEVKGHHFFTRYSQMTAFRYAAVHYQAQLNNQKAKALFLKANEVENSLQNFVDPRLHVVVPTLPGSEGIQKPEGLDISVILALNYFGSSLQPSLSQTPKWSYSSPAVLYTAYKISDTFKKLYPINSIYPEMAPAIGRYPEDVYDGTGFSEGHPWFLATYGMAEFYCALVQELLDIGELNMDSFSQTFYSQMNPQAPRYFKDKVSSSQEEFGATLRAIQTRAESSIQRANFHGGSDEHYSEQFNRHSGFMRGAVDLTWSYVSKIRALGRCQTSSEMLQAFKH